MVESGWFYGTFIDPVLQNMRTQIAAQVKPGESVIDIACGTGAQVFAFSQTASKAVGVDLSESMIEWAQKNRKRKNIPHVEFHVADATELSLFQEKEFDVATMSLALHQFEPELHPVILNEMKRIAKKLIIVDYSVPLPKNYAGYGSQVAEFFAGLEHHANFKKYYAAGGLNHILPANSLQIKKSLLFGKNAFQLTISSE